VEKNIFIPKTQFVLADSLFSFPQSKGWRRDLLYRGDGERFLVNGEKKGDIGNLLEKVFGHFNPYITIFFYWGGDREAAEVALKSV
jgi:hypothetical protein